MIALISAIFLVFKHVTRYFPLCVPTTPALTRLPVGELSALRADLVAVAAHAGGRVHSQGQVSASEVWRDNPASDDSLHLAANGLGPASYEVGRSAPDPWLGTWWEDNTGVDVFEFASAGQAVRFYEQASSVACHRLGLVHAALRLARARALVWQNPDGNTQEDLFIVRGTRVYRVYDVRPEADRVPPQWGSWAIGGVRADERLSCAIADANCAITDPLERSRESGRVAVCMLSAELTSEYRHKGPWELSPMRARTRAVVRSAIARLRAIIAPRSQRQMFAELDRALARLLPLGRQAGLAVEAGHGERARRAFAAMRAPRQAFVALTRRLQINECTPIQSSPRAPTLTSRGSRA